MKETLVVVLIFLSFGILCFLATKNTEKTVNLLSGYIEECEKQISEDNWSEAESSAKKAREVFSSKSHVLESYLLHDDIEQLSDILTDIEVSVELREKRSGISSVRIFLRRLSELAEADKLTIDNIL